MKTKGIDVTKEELWKLKEAAKDMKLSLKGKLKKKCIDSGKDIVRKEREVACYVIVGTDGAFHNPCQICHAGLFIRNYMKNVGRIGDIFGIVNNIQNMGDALRKYDREVIHDYLHWLMNESPYNAAFITRDPKNAIKYGVMMTAKVNAEYLAGACVSLRNIWENSEIMFAWHKLVKHGMDKNLAYYVAHAAKCVDRNTMYFNMYREGHCALESYAPLEKVRLFTLYNTHAGKYHLEQPYSKTKYYQYINRFWSEDCGKVTKGDSLKGFLNNIVKKVSTKEGKVGNPFAKAVDDTNVQTYLSDEHLPMFIEEVTKAIIGDEEKINEAA